MLNGDTMHWALIEAGIAHPDWGRIGKELGLELKEHITASLFIDGWRMHGSEMSWERLAHSLEGVGGFESAAKKAKLKAGNVMFSPCRQYATVQPEISNLLGITNPHHASRGACVGGYAGNMHDGNLHAETHMPEAMLKPGTFINIPKHNHYDICTSQ